MTGWLTALGPAGTALALLLLGHVLGDFVFQTDELARTKHRVGPLLVHAGIVNVVHLLTFLPLLTTRTALVVGSIGVCHFLIDAVSARIRRLRPSSALSAINWPTSSSSWSGGRFRVRRRGRTHPW
jgi:hypothetical protein